MSKSLPYVPCEVCGRRCVDRGVGRRRCARCNQLLGVRSTRAAARQYYVSPAARDAADAAEVERRVELYAAMNAEPGGIRYDDPRLWEG